MYSLDKKYGLGKAPIRNTLGKIVHPIQFDNKGGGVVTIGQNSLRASVLDNVNNKDKNIKHQLGTHVKRPRTVLSQTSVPIIQSRTILLHSSKPPCHHL